MDGRGEGTKRELEEFAEGRRQSLTRFMKCDGGNQRVGVDDRTCGHGDNSYSNRMPFLRIHHLPNANVT